MKNNRPYVCNFILFLVLLSCAGFSKNIYAESIQVYPEIRTQHSGLESYMINIFCTEIVENTSIKAVTGSGVFLDNPNNTNTLILTNAHVARYLLDPNMSCVGRTGNPAQTTHRLTLRYIPSLWLENNIGFVLGDINKESIGEFDFALIEAERIVPKKIFSVYDIFIPKLTFQLKDYGDASGIVYSYPAEKTLPMNIYNPLYLKKDSMHVQNTYTGPALQDKDALLDIVGTENIDHGSSGGMVITQGTTNNLLGIVTSLVEADNPQIVRVVTLHHIVTVAEKDLKTKLFEQSNPLETIKNSKMYILKLNDRTDETLKNIGIISN
jgi:hypothetical protein